MVMLNSYVKSPEDKGQVDVFLTLLQTPSETVFEVVCWCRNIFSKAIWSTRLEITKVGISKADLNQIEEANADFREPR